MATIDKKQSGSNESFYAHDELNLYLFKHHPHPMWIYDVDTLKFIDVNDVAVINYGYSKKEFLKLTLKDIRPKEDIPLLLNNIQTESEVLQRSRNFRHKKKDGSIIRVEITSYKIPSQAGKNYRLVTAIDITEQYHAEELLRKSEHKFNMLFQKFAYAAFLSRLTDGALEDVNEAFERTFGFTKLEAVGKTTLELGINPDSEVRNRILNGLKQTGFLHNQEMKLHTRSGEIRWFDVNMDIINIDGKDHILNIAQDITERKTAEEKLKDNYVLLKIAGEKVKLGGWNVNLEKNRVYWSDEVAAIHEMPAGYHPLVDEAINFYAPEWFDKIIKVFTDCTQNGIPYDEEMQIITANGKRVWVRTIGEPVRDEAGKIIKVQGAFQDITDQKQTENRLKESHNTLVNILESMTDGFVSLDNNWRYTYMNEQAGLIFGRNPEKMIGKHIWTEFPEGIGQPFHLAYEKAMKEQIPIQIQEYYPPYNKWFENRIYPSKDGISIFFQDITYRKKTEEELNKHRKTLQLFVEHAPAAIAMFDTEMKYLAYSKRYLIDYDLGERDITGKSHYEIFPEIPDRWKEIHKCCLAGAIERNEEDRFPRADGSVDWIRWEIHPWYEHNNEIGGIILFSEVITERIEAKENLKQLMNRLIESEELFRKKASQQLHDEVGQNLTALTINLNYISTQLPKELNEKVVNRLQDSLSILDSTVEQIRNIMVELRPSVLDDYGLFAALKWSVNIFKERTNINVVFNGKELSNRLPINKEYAIFRTAQEIFHNITKHAHASNVSINLEESNDSVKLLISDDGIGFDTTLIKKSSGFGLQSISERMKLIDADFNIFSEPGSGTSISIGIKR